MDGFQMAQYQQYTNPCNRNHKRHQQQQQQQQQQLEQRIQQQRQHTHRHRQTQSQRQWRQPQEQQQQQQEQQQHHYHHHQNVHRHKHSRHNLLSLFVGLCVLHLCTNRVLADTLKQQQQQQQQKQQQQNQKQLQIATHTGTLRIQQCREGCLEKFTATESICRQQSECLTCWDECDRTPPPKISKTIRETWSLHTVSMLQQDSLVLVDVAWEPLSLPNQCLVTWEVAGGGLMGNLLTESFNVQLSLWPDTKYRVQVTCKNKLTGLMSRSLPLIIDTSEAVKSLDTNLAQSHLHPTLRKQEITSYITNVSPFRTSTTTIMTTKLNSITKTPFNTPTTTTPVANIITTISNRMLNKNSVLSANKYHHNYDATNDNDHYHTSYENQNIMKDELHVKNFIFNWHKTEDGNHKRNRNQNGNGDGDGDGNGNGNTEGDIDEFVSAVEPIATTKSSLNLNIFNLTALSDIQKPLCYGMLLLIIVLLTVCCLMRLQRMPRASDKRVLIDETDDDIQKQATSISPVDLLAANKSTVTLPEDICKNPAICSRYVLKV